jgi:hypothetical protein
VAKEWRSPQGGRTHPQGQAVSRGGWAPPFPSSHSSNHPRRRRQHLVCAPVQQPRVIRSWTGNGKFPSSVAVTGARTAQVKKYIQAGKFENGDEWVATPGCWMIFEVTLLNLTTYPREKFLVKHYELGGSPRAHPCVLPTRSIFARNEPVKHRNPPSSLSALSSRGGSLVLFGLGRCQASFKKGHSFADSPCCKHGVPWSSPIAVNCNQHLLIPLMAPSRVCDDQQQGAPVLHPGLRRNMIAPKSKACTIL